MKKLTFHQLLEAATIYTEICDISPTLPREHVLADFAHWLQHEPAELNKPPKHSITELLQQHLENLENNPYRFQPDGTHRIGNEINKVKQAIGLIKELQRGKEAKKINK